jgi:hypothetical protein
MSMFDVSLTTEEAWVGVWVRRRTFPTPRAWAATVKVEPWHLIGPMALDTHGRLRTVCRRLRYGLHWPGGLGALEISRPNGIDVLPGAICPRCLVYRPPEDEVEEPIADLDALADRVASRLIERAEAIRALAETPEEPE